MTSGGLKENIEAVYNTISPERRLANLCLVARLRYRGCSPQTVLVEEYSSSSDEFELDDRYKHNPSAPAPTTLLNLLLQFSAAC